MGHFANCSHRVGKIAFVNGIQFRLDGSSGDLVYENVLIFVHEEILSFLLLSPDGNMDHILDVAPLASMKSIAGVGDQSSQARELEIRFGLGSDGSIVAFWNGHQSEIGEILVRMDLDSAEAISPELLEACPSAKIIRLDGSEVPRELRQRGLSGDAIYLGSPDLPRRLDPGDESPNGEHSQQVTNTGEILSNALSVTKAGAFKKTQLDSASESHYVENEDLYDANPPKPKLRGVKASRQHEQEGQDDSSTKSRALSDGSSSTILRVGVRRINTAKEQNAKVDPAKKQRARNAVRPKAKKPLVQSQRRVDDSQNQSQKQIVITSTGNMTKKQIPHTPVVAPTENLAPPSSNVPKAARYVREDTNHQKLQSGQTATGKEATSKSQPKTVPIGSKPSTAQVPPSSMIEPSTAADLRNASAADTYDDDSIPSPDFGDASTPKVRPSISERCQKTGGHVTKEISQSQKNGLSLPVPTQRASQSQKKRYSLNPPLKADTTRPAEASQFEIPLNEDDHLGKKTTSKTSKTPKTKTKAVSATGKVTKQKTTKESAVATVKKRQSAPAALDGGIAPSRSSQRAAATKAKDKIRDIDDGGDNFDMDIDEELPSLSNAKTRVDGKMSISKSKAESKVESQSEVVKDERSWSQHEAVENGNKSKGADKTGSKTEAVRLVSEPRSTVDDEAKMAKKQTSYESSKVNEDTKDYVPTQIEDEVVQRLQQEDAIELGLIQQSSPPFNPEDLHANSTPQLPVKQELPRNTIGTDKSKQGSSLTKLDHFANMLGGMLDEVSDVGDEVLSRGQQVQEPKHLSQAAAVSETRQKNSQSHEQDPIVISSPPPSETPSSIEFFGPNEDAELSNDMASAPSAEGFVTRKTTSPQNKEEIDHNTTAVSTLRTKELTAIEYTLPQHKDKSKYTASAPSMEKHTTRKSPLPQAIAQPSSSELLYSSQKDASSSFTKMRGDSSISRTEVTVIKPVFTKLDIFKKPDLPATIATQLNDPEGRLVESATTISESEVAQEIITIPSMNTDNNIEQEEGMDETRIKRKAPTLENLVSKKPRSTRTGEEVASNNIAHGPLSRNAPELKPASPSPITGSPDLPPHIHTTAQKSSEGASMEPSTEKDPSRKPNIIAFDRRGPLNQGQLNMSKSSTRREIRTIDKEVLPERKRKRNQEAIAGNPSPPKKRQNSSPVHNDDNYDYEENALTYNQIPVAAPADRHVSIGSRSTRSRSCLQSYLPSRVALNGSPVGAGEVNHFGRLEERLSQASNQHEPNDQQTDPDQPSITTQELPALFGPKIQLGAKPKLRGSSPEEVTTRYIAHERTRNGQYKEIGSEGVITPDNVVDPFVDRTRKSSSSSDFTDKLLESSKLKDHSNIAPQPSGQPRNVQNDKSQAKQIPREGYRAGYHPATTNYRKSTRSQYAVQDSVKTLAESDVRHPRPTSPESNLSGSSQESHSSDNSEKDDPRVLRDVWNMAIRPHYSDAHRAIHTIADVG